MFLLDDILMAPAHGIMRVFREIHNAAKQEKANEGQTTRNQLSELYMELETGRITEADFDRQEKELLDRLDKIEDANRDSEETEPEDKTGPTAALSKD